MIGAAMSIASFLFLCAVAAVCGAAIFFLLAWSWNRVSDLLWKLTH